MRTEFIYIYKKKKREALSFKIIPSTPTRCEFHTSLIAMGKYFSSITKSFEFHFHNFSASACSVLHTLPRPSSLIVPNLNPKITRPRLFFKEFESVSSVFWGALVHVRWSYKSRYLSARMCFCLLFIASEGRLNSVSRCDSRLECVVVLLLPSHTRLFVRPPV